MFTVVVARIPYEERLTSQNSTSFAGACDLLSANYALGISTFGF